LASWREIFLQRRAKLVDQTPRFKGTPRTAGELDLPYPNSQNEEMEQSEHLSEKSWAAIWIQAGKELEAIRRREIRCVDTRMTILSLADAFESALLHQPIAASSGLIEMQRLFGQVSDGAVDQNSH
jgi:hypothetical protein